MSDLPARRRDFAAELATLIDTYGEALGPAGLAAVDEAWGLDNRWTADDLDSNGRPRYAAAWALVIELREIADPEAGSFVATFAPPGLSPVYVTGLFHRGHDMAG